MVACASAQVQGVITGYAIDSHSGFLRPILGIPGSSRLGDPVFLPWTVSGGEVHNGRAVVISGSQPDNRLLTHLRPANYGQGETSNAGHAYLVRNLNASIPQVMPLATSIGTVSRVFLSAGGTAALLYSAASGMFQLAGGLDSTPSLSDPFSLALLRGTFSGAAVADSGSDACALLASSDASNAYIQEICSSSGGGATPVAQIPGAQITSLTWLNHDHDAALADQSGNQILLLPNVGLGWTPVFLAGAANGISSPSAVVALDDSRIAVSQSGSPKLLVIDSSHHAPAQSFSLPVSPEFLEPLDASGVLAATALVPGPMLLIDTNHDFGSFFVPAD